MHIRVGFELVYQLPQATPMVLVLERALQPRVGSRRDRTTSSSIRACPSPGIATASETGAAASLAPLGASRASRPTPSSATRDCTDEIVPGAMQFPVERLPEEALMFLLGSRYCETDRLLRHRVEPLRGGAHRAGVACRPSATSSTTTSRSATSTRARPRRPGKSTTSAKASAATSPTSPSPSAAA